MNTTKSVRVLYVEDDDDSYEMLKMLLGFSEIDVVPARDFDEALERACLDTFDLYLLDNKLPHGNGFDLCRKLREYDSKTPIVFYSGNVRAADIELGMSAGANAYLTKPNSETIGPTILRLVQDLSLPA